MLIASVYIIENTFDLPSDITAIPQSYTVHCIIVGGESIQAKFRYYYQDSSNVKLTSTHCLSQTVGYDCSVATDNTVTTDVSPDDVIDKTITVTWEAKEISSGAFRQDNNNDDHVIECSATRNDITRTSTVTIEGISLYCDIN